MSNNNRHGIYVVSNPAMPGLLKIGFTKKTIGQRLAQLNTTGVPAPFRCEAFFPCNRLELVESRIHRDLERFRYRNGREFFKISVKEATTVAQKHAASYPRNIDDPPDKWRRKTKKELASEKEKALLKAIENAKTRDEVTRIESELRGKNFGKAVRELGGKSVVQYVEVMAGYRLKDFDKERKKKEEEKKWKQEVERRRAEQKEYDSRGTLGKIIFQVGKFF
jgi:T5orf172 domain